MTDTPTFVQTLTDTLERNLREAGIDCKVRQEPVQGTKMYRFFVVAEGFKQMQHSERQTVVWRIVDKAIQPSDAVKVSMIMTLTPEEFGET